MANTSKTTRKPTKTVSEIVPEQFPQIWAVAKLIAYDNGLVNRFMSEDDYLGEIASIIAEKPVIKVIEVEAWLKDKTDEQLDTIANGESEEMAETIKDSPDSKFVNELFNAFFEGE